jgi:homoserine dehydrogenase
VSLHPDTRALRIGLLGLGTVGAGTYRVLRRNQSLIQARVGRELAITLIAVRNRARAADIVGKDVALTSDPFAVATHPDIDVVVEVIGGTTLARDLVLQAIAHGKHVVTANKALLAEHGAEIFAAAEARNVIVAYEGAVAVSIPIIKALREGLVANRIEWLAGIINGTSNFILSAMHGRGLSFAAALAQAQAQGFAEADPRLDVDGIDAAHKLTLLAANAFGTPVQFDQVHIEGITQLDAVDMVYAAQLGYCIKLLGVARRSADGLALGVYPALIPATQLLAAVDGSMNAVVVQGDACGNTLHYGAGAGSEQTASAVIADLVDVARASAGPSHQRVPALGFQSRAQLDLPVQPVAQTIGSYYLRIELAANLARPSEVLLCLADAGVGVQQHAVLQHAQDPARTAFTVLTLPVQHAVLMQTVARLRALAQVLTAPTVLRVEHLLE